jgi:hypothetical protein
MQLKQKNNCSFNIENNLIRNQFFIGLFEGFSNTQSILNKHIQNKLYSIKKDI